MTTKTSWRTALALLLGAHVLVAQPAVGITNAPAGLTLTITNAAGISQIDVSTFRFYLEGVDTTVAFVAFLQSGSPLLTLVGTTTSSQVFIAADLTAYHFAAQVCTLAGLCGTHGVTLERFGTTLQNDGAFSQTFGMQKARWNAASAPGLLAGRLMSGSPPGSIGTRVQFTVDPQPPTTSPGGLFSPFDASSLNSGGQCGTTGCNLGLGINPLGGSHIMHLYQAAELSNQEDSLEQIEWSPVTTIATPTVYPNYKIWCGVSSISATLSGAGTGMWSTFDHNYDLAPYQTGIPLQPGCGLPGTNGAKVPCGGPIPYTVTLSSTTFYPFPVLSPCFDFSTSGGVSGTGVNLLVEQDIDPGSQVPNFNRYRATAFTPVRRLLEKPISLMAPGACPLNQGGTFDIYRMRFTFVGLVSQARSLWYDTGTPDPTYQSFILDPPLTAQPAGTRSTWILEGTDVLNPTSATVGTAGTYINAAGLTFPTVLSSTISHLRYFRFRIEFRGNNLANTSPAYTSVAMVSY